MIKPLADKYTAAIFEGFQVKKLPKEIQETARRKLKQIDAADTIESLRVPPGNRLERLKKGKRPTAPYWLIPQAEVRASGAEATANRSGC